LRKRFPAHAKIIVELCEILMAILHFLQPPLDLFDVCFHVTEEQHRDLAMMAMSSP
jgi:hypothetical protein